MDRTYDFQAGEVLLVHKPLHWTSFDVVNKLRYEMKQKLGIKKIKVGHAGTLDPLADGLLILCTGKKTKEIESFMGLEKNYTGTITLGATTPSYDLETEIDNTFTLENITEQAIQTEVQKMIGVYAQYPPIFSAKKVKGQKAYDLARAGKEVILEPKEITIHSFDLTEIKLPLVHFDITCSKGTYIRSIAFDLGKQLNNGGHLSSLRREKIGTYDLKNAHTVTEWIDIIQASDMNNNTSI
ncbi:MAG: tRNA pseudouridine55 synthase [Crocinitomix sp.]|jgi:tRNA pseudouridine55 synthase